jgi:hypothetical protein
MANESSENTGATVSRAPNWDHPDGLGWRLWRRAQTTGLLTQPIQRQLARSQAVFPRDPVPLATAIRRRWAAGENAGAAWYLGDLPFFLERFALSQARLEPQLSMPRFTTARRSVNASPVSSAHAIAPGPVATTSTSSPSAGGAGEAAQAMAVKPQSAGGSDYNPANSVAQRNQPLSPSLTEVKFVGRSVRVASPTFLARSNLPPRAPIEMVRAVPLNRGTANIISAIGARHMPMTALLRHASVKSWGTENRSPFTDLQATYEVSAPSITYARGGESRTDAQRPVGATATPAEFGPSRTATRALSLAVPASDSDEKNISRNVSATAEAGAVASGQETSTTNREAKTRAVERESAAEVYGARADPVLLPGGVIPGVMPRSLGIGPQSGPAQGTPTVMWPQSAPTPATIGAYSARSLSARVILRSLSTRIYDPVPRIGFSSSPLEVGVGIEASSGGAKGSIERKISSGQQPQPMTFPVATIQSDQVRERIGAISNTAAPSQEIGVTIGAPSVATQGFTEGKTFAAMELQTVDAPSGRRSGVGDQRSSSEQQLQTIHAWPLGQVNDFAARHTAPVLVARTTPFIARLAAMPLSISPVLKRVDLATGSGAQRVFSKIAVASPTILRAEHQVSARADGVPPHGETGAEIASAAGGTSQALRARESSDNTPVLGLYPRPGITEATSGAGHYSSTSRRALPAHLHPVGLSVVNAHAALRLDAGIFRAGAELGKIPRPGSGGNLHGWLTLHHGGLSSSGRVPWARSLIRRAAGLAAAPMFVARRADIRASMGGELRGVATPERPIQSPDASSSGWLPALAAVAPSEFQFRTGDVAPVLLPARETSYDMPFVSPTLPQGKGGLTVARRGNGTSIQSASQLPVSGLTRPLPIGEVEPTRAPEAPTGAAKPQINLDEIVEKTWQKLMRKLTVERERRGYSRWV